VTCLPSTENVIDIAIATPPACSVLVAAAATGSIVLATPHAVAETASAAATRRSESLSPITAS